MSPMDHDIGIVSDIATMFGYAQAMDRAFEKLELAVTS